MVFLKAALVFFILFISIAINLPSSFITRMGFDADYLKATLVAVIITGLISNKRLLLIVLVVGCSIIANMPAEIVRVWGINQDIVFSVLVVIVFLPLGAKILGRF